MTTRNYPRLPMDTFGAQLIETEDLDPVYVALKAIPDKAQLHRWLLAYWCFYNCGVASFLSERKDLDFWEWCLLIVNDKHPPFGMPSWPRGRERRHYRGDNAIRSMGDLISGNAFPESVVAYLANGSLEFHEVQKRAQTLTGFGPWISWKMCDMLDRCAGIPVDFSNADLCMYRDPVKAAVMWCEKELHQELPPDQAVPIAVDFLAATLGHMKAPPSYERTLNVQEYETVLCKWKAHMNGFYALGTDTREIREALEHWTPYCHTAKLFCEALPC